MDATTALRCSASGAGFDVVACPTGTACAGPGVCQGSCVVGSALCQDSNTLSTCSDGSTYSITLCAASQACVTTGADPFATAACKAADCTPDPNGCDFVCGNKANASSPNQGSTMSTCTETPNGYKWVAIQCAGAKTCNPSGNSCGGTPGTQAACTEECNPGDSRCTDSLDYQTCGTDWKWGTATTACNAANTLPVYQCFTVGNATNKAVCGDVACSNGGTGSCDSTGKFHACGDDAKVSATGVACTSGICVTSGNVNDPTVATGSCQTQCNAGDEQCIGISTYVTCTNGAWGVPQQCAAGGQCEQTSVNGAPRKLCGAVCQPGDHQCGGTTGEQIRVCDQTDNWGAYTDCATGICGMASGASDESCIAQCFPGRLLCLGNNASVPGMNIEATDAVGTCTAKGLFPTTSTTCDSAKKQYCRRGPGVGKNPGPVLGCLTCVGTQNEYGLHDTKCSSADGTANSGNYIAVCKADSSGWDGASTTQCVARSSVCHSASTTTPVPAFAGNYCHTVDIFGSQQPLTESLLENLVGETCMQANLGPPVACAVEGGGSVPDCCTGYCFADAAPTPAFCESP